MESERIVAGSVIRHQRVLHPDGYVFPGGSRHIEISVLVCPNGRDGGIRLCRPQRLVVLGFVQFHPSAECEKIQRGSKTQIPPRRLSATFLELETVTHEILAERGQFRESGMAGGARKVIDSCKRRYCKRRRGRYRYSANRRGERQPS